jgi:hypothetical protein
MIWLPSLDTTSTSTIRQSLHCVQIVCDLVPFFLISNAGEWEYEYISVKSQENTMQTTSILTILTQLPRLCA